MERCLVRAVIGDQVPQDEIRSYEGVTFMSTMVKMKVCAGECGGRGCTCTVGVRGGGGSGDGVGRVEEAGAPVAVC